MDSPSKPDINGFYISFSIKVSQIALQTIIQVLLVRATSKETFGEYSFVVAVIGVLAAIIQLGFPEVSMREVAKSIAANSISAANRILFTSVVRFSSFFVLLLVIFLSANQIITLELSVIDHYWLQIVAIIFSGGIVRIISGYYRGRGRYLLGLIGESIAFSVIFLVVFLSLFGNVSTSKSLLDIHMFAMLSTCMFLFISLLLTRSREKSASVVHIHLSNFRYWSAVWVIGLQIGVHMIFSFVDIILLSIMTTMDEVAEYRVAAQIAQISILAQTAFSGFFSPRIAAAFTKNDYASINNTITIYRKYAFGYSICVLIILGIAGSFLIPIIFGETYELVYGISLILVAGYAVNIAIGPIGILLNMSGNQNATLIASTLALATNVILNFIFINKYGAYGAAMATAISLILSKSVAMFLAYRLGLLSNSNHKAS